MIEVKKKYKTRSGFPVQKLKIPKDNKAIVTGEIIRPDQKPEHCAWFLDGSKFNGQRHDHDLIEIIDE